MAIVNPGDYQDFAYKGSVETFTIPFNGIYKLEVWGASGGDHQYSSYYSSGGKAGYSYGYKTLNANGNLYVCCGQAGQTSSRSTSYNGGGGGGKHGTYGDYDRSDGGGGGGATHIATRTGILANLSSYKSDVLIVAGGGGGATFYVNGAEGGGTSGGSSNGATGGTQTSGYKFGQGQNGQSGNDNVTGNACSGTGGGGGGYYGGKSASDRDPKPGGGGGSGYIGGVEAYNGDNPSTQNGVWPQSSWYYSPTNGKARITYVAPSTYTVSLSVDPSGTGNVTGSGTYNANSSVTITASGNAGYNFTGWYNGSTLVSSSSSYTFTITSNVSYTAKFVLQTKTVTLSVSPSGSGNVTGAGTYNYGSSVTITATPNSRYNFVNWSDGNISASRTITVTSNISLTANFSIKRYTLSLSSNPSNGGTTTGSGTYDIDSNVTINAIPNSGFKFLNWSDGNVSPTRTITVTNNISLTANFKKKPSVKFLIGS